MLLYTTREYRMMNRFAGPVITVLNSTGKKVRLPALLAWFFPSGGAFQPEKPLFSYIAACSKKKQYNE